MRSNILNQEIIKSSARGMKAVFAPRASAIIYNLLRSHRSLGLFLLPANICPIVPLTFMKAKIPFEFVDISPLTLHMDLEQVENRLRARKPVYGGLLYAHSYGEPSTPGEFFHELKKFNPALLIIDDRCLCVPELQFEIQTSVDVTLFSTGYSKIVDLGYGGYAFLQEHVAYEHNALKYQSPDLETLQTNYERCISARTSYSYVNSNWLETDSLLPEWQDYRGRLNSATERSLEQRRAINAVYQKILPEAVRLADAYQLWRFNIRVPNKEKVLAAIFQAQLFASSHYASLSGIMKPGSAPVAEALATEMINLFNNDRYTIDMAEHTAHIVLENL